MYCQTTSAAHIITLAHLHETSASVTQQFMNINHRFVCNYSRTSRLSSTHSRQIWEFCWLTKHFNKRLPRACPPTHKKWAKTGISQPN